MKLLSAVIRLLAVTGSALGASLQAVTNFGTNPTNIQMYIYVPDKLAAKPAIIVAVCLIPGKTHQLLNAHWSSCTLAEDPLRSGTRAPNYHLKQTAEVSSSSTPRPPAIATAGM